jgi:hypothetical protein
MGAQEFTHRTAETNINGDKQREVVRVNASHIQFARNDLGSSVWSSFHQTQPSFTDSTGLSFSHATFIHFRHDYMFVSSTNHAFSCTRSITVTQCRLQLSTNKMYYIITTTQSQIGYSTVSLCRIHVYYGVVNVLWAHRSKSIRKLHMHRGLQDIWYRNNMFINFASVSIQQTIINTGHHP